MLDINSLQPLPEFSWSECHLRSVDKNYFDYYGINFSEKLAQKPLHHFGQKQLAGYSIATHYFELQQSKGSVLLLHGYMDHTGLYNHIIELLLNAGFNVLVFDLPGHGLSSGEQAGIPDFADYQKVLSGLMLEAQKILPKPWYIVAQSTGGAIAMDYLMNHPTHEFSKAVLLAPLVIPQKWSYIKLQLLIIGWFLKAIPREFVINSHDDEFLFFLKYRDPLQSRKITGSWVKALYHWQKHFQLSAVSATPLLVIQGDEDTTVDWRYNLKHIANKFSNYKEVLVKDARHHLVKETEALRNIIFTEVLSFIDDKGE